MAKSQCTTKYTAPKPHNQTKKFTLHKMLASAKLYSNKGTLSSTGAAFHPELGQDINVPIPAVWSNQNCQIIIIGGGADPAPPPSFVPNKSNKCQHIIQTGDVFAEAFGDTMISPKNAANLNFSITTASNSTNTTIATAFTSKTAADSNEAPQGNGELDIYQQGGGGGSSKHGQHGQGNQGGQCAWGGWGGWGRGAHDRGVGRVYVGGWGAREDGNSGQQRDDTESHS